MKVYRSTGDFSRRTVPGRHRTRPALREDVLGVDRYDLADGAVLDGLPDFLHPGRPVLAEHLRLDVCAGRGGYDGVDRLQRAGQRLVHVDVLARLDAAHQHVAAALHVRRRTHDVDVVSGQGRVHVGEVRDAELLRQLAAGAPPEVGLVGLGGHADQPAPGVVGEYGAVRLLVSALAPYQQYAVFAQLFVSVRRRLAPYPWWYRLPLLPTRSRSRRASGYDPTLTVTMAPCPPSHVSISVR